MLNYKTFDGICRNLIKAPTALNEGENVDPPMIRF